MEEFPCEWITEREASAVLRMPFSFVTYLKSDISLWWDGAIRWSIMITKKHIFVEKTCQEAEAGGTLLCKNE